MKGIFTDFVDGSNLHWFSFYNLDITIILGLCLADGRLRAIAHVMQLMRGRLVMAMRH
jgi:hypothetical protein